MADQVFVFKRTVRETAQQHNMYATFAKPMQKEPGSALHIHQSILSLDTGKNIFNSADNEPTPELMHYIAGLQRYTPDLISFYAPNVNSIDDSRWMSAPINLSWGMTAAQQPSGFRIARLTTGVSKSFPGADANPYLAIAASLASGLLGLENNCSPPRLTKARQR